MHSSSVNIGLLVSNIDYVFSVWFSTFSNILQKSIKSGVFVIMPYRQKNHDFTVLIFLWIFSFLKYMGKIYVLFYSWCHKNGSFSVHSVHFIISHCTQRPGELFQQGGWIIYFGESFSVSMDMVNDSEKLYFIFILFAILWRIFLSQ